MSFSECFVQIFCKYSACTSTKACDADDEGISDFGLKSKGVKVHHLQFYKIDILRCPTIASQVPRVHRFLNQAGALTSHPPGLPVQLQRLLHSRHLFLDGLNVSQHHLEELPHFDGRLWLCAWHQSILTYACGL